MNKNTIRLKKSDLSRMISEAVTKNLNEVGDTHAGQYMLGRLAARLHNKSFEPCYHAYNKREVYRDDENTKVSKEIAYQRGWRDYNTGHPITRDELERYSHISNSEILRITTIMRELCQRISRDIESHYNRVSNRGDVDKLFNMAARVRYINRNEYTEALLESIRLFLVKVNSRSDVSTDMIKNIVNCISKAEELELPQKNISESIERYLHGKQR